MRNIPVVRSRLQRRIILIIASGTVLMAFIFSVSGYLAVKESIDRTMEERLSLAMMTANYIDDTLRQNLLRLEESMQGEGVDLRDNNLDSERRALRDAYFQTIFNDSVFFTDRQGLVLWAEPEGETERGQDLALYPYIREALTAGRQTASPLISAEPSGKPMVGAATPIRDRRGEVFGLVGGNIDLTASALTRVISPVKLGTTGYIEVVDGNGAVLATTRPELLFTQSDHGRTLAGLIAGKQTAVSACHNCHGSVASDRENEVMAFAPLASFPWGVSIRQSETEALAPARTMEKRFVILGLVFVALGAFVAVAVARSVIRPVNALRAGAGRIAAGDLDGPMSSAGRDELGELAESLETMRAQLKESMAKAQRWNRELEAKVWDRTRELQAAEAARADLLKRLIYAQEDERKRIARELHDETSQNMARTVMSLDKAASKGDAPRAQDLAETRELLLKTIEGVHRIIFDLRPAILDDLGLVPALQWYAERRLAPQGINVTWEVNSRDVRLPGIVETALFRIAQEALTNVARHARAENVIVSIDFSADSVTLEVEDDGVGFDPSSVPQGGARGLGLMGMKERVTILGGQIDIRSQPGAGAAVHVWLPLPSPGEGGGHRE